MDAPRTEMSHARSMGFDLLEAADALATLAQAQVEAAQAVQTAIPQIAVGAQLMAQTIRGGGKLVYAAAGSSGLMALADALELPGTYGIPRDRVRVLLAGGMEALQAMEGGPEDDEDAARKAVSDAGVGPGDCLLALTASGSTPYPLAAVQAAHAAGAKTIGLANNTGARLFEHVDVAVCLPTPPEVIAGSTRMGAGTAQKIALNMLSTMMAVELGHVHDGFMVNVVADNIKLRGRAKGMIAQIAGSDETSAAEALAASGGAVKLAILLAAGAKDLDEAEMRLRQSGGKLRPALEALRR